MGINPYTTTYPSQPLSLDIPGSLEPWRVNTFSGGGYGISTLAQATLRSDNTVYAQLALDVTPERIIDVARRMGITSTLNANPAIALGGLSYGVSPLEMASAYSTLGNMGRHVNPTAILRVKNSKGEVLYEARPKEVQSISEGVAYVVNDLLARNVESGTGWRARLSDRPSAGKTGTAQDYHDAWYCGYIPQLSTAVWVGHPEAQIAMTNVHGMRVTGGSFPAIIWQKFMSRVIADYPAEAFPKPAVPATWDYTWKSKYAVEPTTTTESTESTTTTLDPSTTLPGPTTTSTSPPGPTTTRTTGPATTTTRPPTTTTTIAPPTTTTTAPPTTTYTAPVPPTA
jgi:penicillin-binding protein 1A